MVNIRLGFIVVLLVSSLCAPLTETYDRLAIFRLDVQGAGQVRWFAFANLRRCAFAWDTLVARG